MKFTSVLYEDGPSNSILSARGRVYSETEDALVLIRGDKLLIIEQDSIILREIER